MIGLGEIFGLFLFLFVPLAVAIVWIVQFVQLMLFEDDLFPGPHDKLGWIAAFVILAPLAPFAFLMWKWKRMRTAEREAPSSGSSPARPE